MAISPARIATELYGSAGIPTRNRVAAPPRYASTGNEACLRQDIAGANALLDESGATDTDGDGVREYIQHDAGVLFGADAVSDPAASYRRFFADVQMYATGPRVDPQGHLEGLSCDHIQTRVNGWAGENNARSCNAADDALPVRLAGLPLGTEREALVRELNDLPVESGYEIPLVLRGSVSAHAKTLVGVRVAGWDSEPWSIAEWRR